MGKEKGLTILRYISAFILLSFSAFTVCAFLSTDYASFLTISLSSLRRMPRLQDSLNNAKLELSFRVLKFLCVLALFVLVYWLTDLCIHRRTTAARKLDRGLLFAHDWAIGNYRWWLGRGPLIKRGLILILILQFLFLLSFLVGLPIHYDEAATYDNFIRQGLVQTATYYPLPNNHILYNLVAVLFSRLPIPVDTAIRLPSVLAAMVSLWYFARLAAK